MILSYGLRNRFFILVGDDGMVELYGSKQYWQAHHTWEQ